MDAPWALRASGRPPALVLKADARNLPLKSGSVDMVATSPPYLNAIDYIRGHKLSLVWMGHTIASLRSLRSENIGTERSGNRDEIDRYRGTLDRMVDSRKLDARHLAMVLRYVVDMSRAFRECRRVLKKDGEGTIVIGDSNVRGVFVRNSEGPIDLASRNGLRLRSRSTPMISENQRYLPPPMMGRPAGSIRSRMREEVVLRFT